MHTNCKTLLEEMRLGSANCLFLHAYIYSHPVLWSSKLSTYLMLTMKKMTHFILTKARRNAWSKAWNYEQYEQRRTGICVSKNVCQLKMVKSLDFFKNSWILRGKFSANLSFPLEKNLRVIFKKNKLLSLLFVVLSFL